MNKKLISQGRTAEVYDIGNNRIVKLFRNNFPSRAIEDEYNISLMLNTSGLSVPEFFERNKTDGRTGLVFEKINGTSMLNLMFMKPWRIKYYARKMAEIHAQIHTKKLDGIPELKTRLEYFINRTDEISDKIKEPVIKYLRQLITNGTLCHGDMHPENILISKDRYYIIDWMTAASGCPEADVARTLVILRYSKVPRKIPLIFRILASISKNLLCGAYLKHYLKISRLSLAEINKWLLPTAAARLFENGPNEEKTALKKLVMKELNRY